MNLVKMEFKKIMKNKPAVLFALITFIFLAGFGIQSTLDRRETIGNLDAYYKLFEPYKGEINEALAVKITQEIDSILNDNHYIMNNKISKDLTPEIRRELYFKFSYSNAYRTHKWWLDNDEGTSFNILKKEYQDIVANSQQNSFTGKDTYKKLMSYENVGAPGFYKTDDWEDLFFYLLSPFMAIFISVTTILAIGPVFSNEIVTGVKRVILSTESGYKKVTRSKVLASLGFTYLYITLIYSISILAFLIINKGYRMWNMPLNSISQFLFTPYHLSALEMLLAAYLVTILASSLLVVCILFISSVCKSNVTSIIIAGVFTCIPLFLPSIDGGIGLIKEAFPFKQLMISHLFSTYESYNIAGQPTLKLPIMVVLDVLLICLFYIFIRLFNRRKDF
ncbi:ABC transporter permease subunit [Paenibacillus macerans]|uniref:ABC-2 transporter family protein n=1 Tax=Paenibacillus macerans TaxID=44252 RepID=A0A090Y869_PAEMA|nr:ABC transporter permease subunit [Paenibacillus macerans]KFM94973.1 ABC-2 transporter family protein [Paenibacillus macerans]MCY7560423.1 ABC transporter permease subunit [Paenibacillus macerans]MEC0153426.1 ABC transporter permease subunit [Paenibacillus macerans]SUD26041.1 ABC-type transport system involved in multi-copper enzyme maturation, permease component [Paenibacillus macerans]